MLCYKIAFLDNGESLWFYANDSQISSPLTFKLLATTPAPRTCVLMYVPKFLILSLRMPFNYPSSTC